MKFLFDLGGVFFDWDPKHFFKNIFSSLDELDYLELHHTLVSLTLCGAHESN